MLFTPYEAILEGAVALAIVATVLVGFLIQPRTELYYVRTSTPKIARNRRPMLEQDFLGVRVEVARLWLLFIPTFLAVSDLVFFAAGGPMKFSYLNWLFSSPPGYFLIFVLEYAPLPVILMLSAWIQERRVLRDAEACSARSFSLSLRIHCLGNVAYLFMGEHGEYFGGYSHYFGLVKSPELARIVFHDVRNPEINKIAMGFLFHRLTVAAYGVTDIDEQTAAAQPALAQVAPAVDPLRRLGIGPG